MDTIFPNAFLLHLDFCPPHHYCRPIDAAINFIIIIFYYYYYYYYYYLGGGGSVVVYKFFPLENRKHVYSLPLCLHGSVCEVNWYPPSASVFLNSSALSIVHYFITLHLAQATRTCSAIVSSPSRWRMMCMCGTSPTRAERHWRRASRRPCLTKLTLEPSSQ